MAKLTDLPSWVQAIVAVLALLGTVFLYTADTRADLQVETTERKAVDERIGDSVDRIEKMLKEEMDRHHPRH